MDKHSKNGSNVAGRPLEESQETAENLSDELRDIAEKARQDIVSRMQSTAKRMRDYAEKTSGDLGSGAEKIAKRFEEGAEHLSNFKIKEAEEKLKQAEEKVEEAVGKVTDTAEENTWKTVVVVLIIGIVIGWLLSNMKD